MEKTLKEGIAGLNKEVEYQVKTIPFYIKEVLEVAIAKEWHDEIYEIGTVLALVHSEVSEALEANCKGDKTRPYKHGKVY